MLSAFRQSLLAAAVLTAAASPALAQEVDGEAFVTRLQAALAQAGGAMSYDTIRVEDDDVIVEGTVIGEGENALNVGTTRFETVSGSTADGWNAERAVVSDFERTEGEDRTNVAGLVFEGLTIHPEGASGQNSVQTPGGNVPIWIERGNLGSMSVSNGGTEVFMLEDAMLAFGTGQDNVFDFDMSIGGFSATVPEQEEPAANEDVLREIGYEQLAGDMSASGLWNTETGELTLSPLQINVEEMADLTFAYSISGYTPQFIAQLSALQEQMRTESEGGGAMAIVGLMSQLNLHSAELRLVDDSLTGRLLDYYAEQNGQSREALVDQLVQSAPAALAALNNPEFQAEVTSAIENFLRDPQSITVAIAPDAPVPVAQIIGAAMGAPQTLPAVLQLTVTSNE